MYISTDECIPYNYAYDDFLSSTAPPTDVVISNLQLDGNKANAEIFYSYFILFRRIRPQNNS